MVDDAINGLRAEMRNGFNRIETRLGDHGRQFERIETRLDGHDRQFERIEARFNRVDERFDNVDAQFQRVDERFENVDAQFHRIGERVDNVDAQFHRIDERVDNVDAQFQSFRAEMRAQIMAEGEATRRHFDMVAEHMRDVVKLVAEGTVRNTERLDDQSGVSRASNANPSSEPRGLAGARRPAHRPYLRRV